MAVITSKQVVLPTRIYRWQKYSANTETITTEAHSAGSTLVRISQSTYGEPYAIEAGAYVGAMSSVYSYPNIQIEHTVGTSETITRTETVSNGAYLGLHLWVGDMESDEALIDVTTADEQFYVTYSGSVTFTVTSKYTYTASTGKHDFYLTLTANKAVEEELDSPITKYSKGSTSYGLVESEDVDAYPDNGHKDGYWYVRV